VRRSPELPSRRRPQKPSVGGRWQIPKNRLRLCDLYYGVSGESQLKPIVRAIGCAGLINRLLVTIEWLSDNGSCYVGDETRRFASNRERCQSKVHRAMEGPKPSSVRSNVTMSASVRARMQRPSCTSSQLRLITTTRSTPTRLSDIVHPVSLSQLTEARDRVRSFGGYNNGKRLIAAHSGTPGEHPPTRPIGAGQALLASSRILSMPNRSATVDPHHLRHTATMDSVRLGRLEIDAAFAEVVGGKLLEVHRGDR